MGEFRLMVPKPEYVDSYTFIEASGLLLIALGFVVPWLILRVFASRQKSCLASPMVRKRPFTADMELSHGIQATNCGWLCQ
jgi:hypothetical protein